MLHITPELVDKYGVSGPRYTSYPTAPIWHDIDRSLQLNWLDEITSSQRPLSFYIHIPFCRSRCYYCGCNTLVTRKQSQSAIYVEHLTKEINRVGKLLHSDKQIRQLHFGGGTPTFLLNEEFEQILDTIQSNFAFETDAEIAIEIDPRTIRTDQLRFLSEKGFNRLSLGVQDFDDTVQTAINRIQSEEMTFEHLQTARSLGFKGINFDLIYGLPFQTLDSFNQTLATVIKMKPDRLAIYNFGYLPERMRHQKKIDPQTLPDKKTRLSLVFETIRQLTDAGYEYIGMDHFALPDDELSIAMRNRTLNRNFMGYTPKSNVDLLGIGMTAISEIGPYFLQNEKRIKTYQEQINETGLAACRGMALSQDDLMRKWTIQRIICHFYLSYAEFKAEFDSEFAACFPTEMTQLAEFQEDGLLELNEDHLRITDTGKVFVRNICMLFDAYINKDDTPKVRYSNTV
ncbi:MAG: oxygen-independent coproporphyrinogen III oxidase [Deltaproteobacteria bacterium]|nr:oxygen-independent coproporphyrinogen III oxidase [Deltaproteobacteria bacterium]